MEPTTFHAVDEKATDKLGAVIAAALPHKAVIALIGPLGAGKTRLVRAIAKAAGVEEGIVASPTFVLVHEYTGRVPIYHFDAYRLRNADEFSALGSEEYFASEGWCFVEWGDRVVDKLPQQRLDITIEPTGPNSRRFTFTAVGDCFDRLLQEMRAQLTPSAGADSAEAHT